MSTNRENLFTEHKIVRERKRKFYRTRTFQINILAFFIGIIGALSAYIFRKMIEGVTRGSSLLKELATKVNIPPYVITIILLLVAAAISGPIIAKWASEAKGHGVPEVIEAVELKQGIIRTRVPLIKAVSSSLAIGTGMSLGSEGPIVQIAGGVASFAAQRAKLKPRDTKLLVVCGISAGISAIFNAPIGGVLFGLEAILMSLTITSIIPIIFSSLISSILANFLMGSDPILSVPIFNLDFSILASEMWIFVILGIIAGFGGILYQFVLYFFEQNFDRFKKIPLTIKLLIGALAVGIIGIWFPDALGVGYSKIGYFLSLTSLDNQDNTFRIIFVGSIIIFLLKLLTTSLSIGSGASGGIFAPGLFLGAALGTVLGGFLHRFLDIQTPIGLFALLGMAALFGGSARVPFTMIIMTAELTGDYFVFLPLMIVVFISYWINEGINKYSIYTKKLADRGIILKRGMLEEYLENFPIIDIMTKDVIVFTEKMEVGEAIEAAQLYRYHGFPIVNDEGIIRGLITIDDLNKAQIKGQVKGNITAHSSCSPNIFCTPFESTKTVLDRMYENRISRIPVIQDEEDKKLVGIVTESDIINLIESQSLRLLQDKRKILKLDDRDIKSLEEEQYENQVLMKNKIKILHSVVIDDIKTKKKRSNNK